MYLIPDRLTPDRAQAEEQTYKGVRVGGEVACWPGSPAAQVDRVYWDALSRPPERAERKDCLQFLRMMVDHHRQQLSGDNLSRDELARTLEARALEALCHVAFNLNEFVFQQ